MMSLIPKLLLDVGNSRLKWALYCDQNLGTTGTVLHNGNLTEALHSVLAELPPPNEVFAGNVMGGDSDDLISRFSFEQWNITTQIIKTQACAFGVENGYIIPERLGVDRWLALIAAHHLYKSTLLIVDAGSATTFDALTAAGKHLGGLILPGLELMQESLLSKTSIPRVEFTVTETLFASDTAEAVSGAAIQSTVALIERLHSTLKESTGCIPHLILTGGNASVVGAQLTEQKEVFYEPDLVMKGLIRFADHRGLE
ncbi:MAG: type III pantothenate kinase [Candidatus Polarisedimenticolaceae bacterium]|nr:type III pantothenate kinase [Candidatus Polarisedimenticolaceae bacterium]